MKPYTIAYFMDYGKDFGGACNTLLCQIMLMKKLGHKVIVFFSDYYGKGMNHKYQEICLKFEIQYEWGTYQISSQPEDIDVVCIDKNYESLRDKVARYNPDILHSVQINVCVELVSRELEVPHIMNIYPLLPEFFSITYMDVFPRYHICDSWYWAQQWKKYLGTDSVCIRTAVIETYVRKGINAGNAVNFICAGSIYIWKNQLSVIKAFHKALKHGVDGKLTLCGYATGNYAEQCIQYVVRNKLSDKVIIKGFCTDMNSEYSKSDVLICGSMRESYPNVISEAMAKGIAVISTPVAGVPEVIRDGENGYLARDYSTDALYEKIIQVAHDIGNGSIEKILNSAEKTFIENHSPEVVSSQLMKFYEHVLDDCSKRNRDNTGTVDNLRNTFQPLIECFYKNRNLFTEQHKISQKLWHLYYTKDNIKNAIDKGSKLYIWGTGKYGIAVKELVEIFWPEVVIAGFTDSNRTGCFFEYKIYATDDILAKKNIVIIVAVLNGQPEIVEQLENNSMVYNRDYFILAERYW